MADIPIKNPVEALPATQQPTDKGEQAPPNIPPPETHVPAGVEDQHCPQKTRSEIREWFKVLIETLTLFAVVWYAVIASRQLPVMRQANQDAETAINNTQINVGEVAEQTAKNFRRQNRPFVAIVVGTVQLVERPMPQVWRVKAQIRDYGVTPGRRIVAKGRMLSDKINWDIGIICPSEKESLDYSYPAAVAFPNSEGITYKFDVERVAAGERYLAVCVSYQDIEGGFNFPGPPPRYAPYNTQHLYEISGTDAKPTFMLIDTSVESAGP